jgi:hypothetical protein
MHSESPFLVYLTIISILRASKNDLKALEVLEEARRTLLDRAERISDPALRESFLTGVPSHKAILDL